MRPGRAGWGQWRTAAAWVAHGWRRWPFEEEGLCGQIMASGLEKRKKKKDILVILWLSTREVVLTSGL